MLKAKLLRLDESMIQELEQLAQDLSKKEYISFSALIRKLIKIGMENMETQRSFFEEIKSMKDSSTIEKEKCLLAIKEEIKIVANMGSTKLDHRLDTFEKTFLRESNNSDYSVFFPFVKIQDVLSHISDSLRSEGFKVSCYLDNRSIIRVSIDW